MSVPRINADIIPCRDQPAWLAERRKRVHASDAPKIIDGSALSVWSEKTSPPLVITSSEWQTIKREMEPAICRLYEWKYGGRVHRWPEYTIAVSREHDWLACTPDALVEDPRRSGIGINQLKAWSEFDRQSWANEPPLYVQVQTQIEMLATGCQWGVVTVMFGSNALERFFVEPNEKLIAAMLPLLRDFMTCVELRTMPPIDGSYETSLALARLHPDDDGTATMLPSEADEWLRKLERAKALRDSLDSQIGSLENQIKAAIGPHTYGMTEAGQWLSWKSQNRGGYTVEPTTFRCLRRCKAPKGISVDDAAPAIDFKVADRVRLPLWLKRQMLADDPHCRWCRATLTLSTATFEHLVPLSVGGTNERSNISIACEHCNNARGCNATLPTSIGA